MKRRRPPAFSWIDDEYVKKTKYQLVVMICTGVFLIGFFYWLATH